MKRRRAWDKLLLVLWVLYDLYPLAPLSPLAAPAPRLPQWIADLASDDFARRDAASKALVEAGDAAIPALEAAAKDPSPEVQARARAALKAIEDRKKKIPPERVLEILHGSAAFVEGGNLTLRDALRPVEKLGLRVDYDKEVDPSQPCTVTKHGQTALELIDQLAETCRLGFRIVPGGVRVVTKERLDALHDDLRQRLGKPMSVEYVESPLGDVMKDLSDTLGVPLVLSPFVRANANADFKITLKVQRLPATSLVKLVLNPWGLSNVVAECRYGMIVLEMKGRLIAPE